MNEAALLRLAAALRDAGYAFTTPTPATHARVNARPGNERARDLRDVFGWSRPFHEGLLPDPIPALMREAGILASHGDAWRSLVRVSTLDGLLFLHSAYPTTDADAVFFGPDTYRYAAALDAHLATHPDPAPILATPASRGPAPIRRAVDIGCGAGPAAILLARARPVAEVHAVDINPAALALTRINATHAGVQVQATHSDLLTALPGEFDLVVSNPPYLADPAERAYRHGGGPLGAALSVRIVEAALPRLAPGGTLLLYTGVAIVNGHDPFREAAEVHLGLHDLNWRYREMDPDVFGEELDLEPYRAADRIAAVVLTATRNG